MCVFMDMLNMQEIKIPQISVFVCVQLLAEELAGRLAVLENNCHPFYKPQEFMVGSF